MLIAIMIWIGAIMFSIVLGTFLCYKIEKSKVTRWGASGKLYK